MTTTTRDILLITIMATLAACGLIYQYLLSNYTGRVLGVMEHAIFTMIGVMIVSMGIGSFAAKLIKCPFTGFAWLEIIIAIFGATGVLIISGAFAFAYILPSVIAENYGMPVDLIPSGGIFTTLNNFVETTPYIIGFIIGLLIGMEIPFIARVREQIYAKHIKHNVGTIYGADYIGAGIGAAIFVLFMLSRPAEIAAIVTAAVNLAAGLLFFFMFYQHIRFALTLLTLHIIVFLCLILLFFNAHGWNQALEDMLYQDKVVFSQNTKFQHITLTKRKMAAHHQPIYDLYLNGRTQFSSLDEHIYHDMLVHPTILASARHNNILVIGGGDGLAVREILKWQPKEITLLELDDQMVSLFRDPKIIDANTSNKILLELNQQSLSDPRVNLILGDAFNTVDNLLSDKKIYDAIIVDLPDPSHPNLNKLYSSKFYKKLHGLLNGDGAITIQSTSPYHAKQAFLTVGITMQHAGFKHVEQYHQNVPSFGQWGWTIATKTGAPASSRINKNKTPPPELKWATKDIILASFIFNKGFFNGANKLEPNRLGSNKMYLLHKQAWIEGL